MLLISEKGFCNCSGMWECGENGSRMKSLFWANKEKVSKPFILANGFNCCLGMDYMGNFLICGFECSTNLL